MSLSVSDGRADDSTLQLTRALRVAARRPPETLEGASRQAVVDQLARMMGGGRVVLLEGPAGSGKSTAVALACAQLPEPKLIGTVSGRSIADQEELLAVVLEALETPRRVSAAENRRYLVHRLAQLKAAGRHVVVVLHDCELCAAGARQSVLYALLDLMQDPDVSYALVLTTRTQDLLDMLEKRVQSRLGSQRLVMPPLAVPEAEAIVRRVLTAPESPEAPWAAAWNATLRGLDLRTAVTLLHRLHCSNVRLFVNFAWLVLALNGSVDAAYEHVVADAWHARMAALSEVELCVLIVMLRPTSGGTPKTLDDAYALYKKKLTQANQNVFPKKLFQRAFLSLSEIADWADWPLPVMERLIEEDADNSLPTYVKNFLHGFA
jgi:hypothetical protein